MCLFVSIPHLNYYNHLRYWCSRVCLIYVYALIINCFGKSEKYKSDRNILVLLFTRYVLGFFFGQIINIYDHKKGILSIGPFNYSTMDEIDLLCRLPDQFIREVGRQEKAHKEK